MSIRYPLDALQRATVGLTHRELAAKIGVKRETVAAWSLRGIPQYQADRAAVACGFHPYCVWPSWFEDGLEVVLPVEQRPETAKCARKGCDERFERTHHRRRFCSARCKNLVSTQKWRRDHPEKVKEYRTAYYDECGDYERSRERRRRATAA